MNEIPKEVAEAMKVISKFCSSVVRCRDCPLVKARNQINLDCYLRIKDPEQYKIVEKRCYQLEVE